VSTPIVGRNGVVKMGTSEIGYAKGVTVSVGVDLIKEYALGDNKPVVLADGNQSYKVTVESMYVDNSFASAVLAGTAVDIALYPNGEGTGKPVVTVSDVVLTSWKLEQKQTGVVMQSVEGEGASLTAGTQS